MEQLQSAPQRSPLQDSLQAKDGYLHEGMALPANRTFSYAFTQPAAPGGKITNVPKGATLGADGRLRAVITTTVAESDGTGAHLKWQRPGQPFSEEWWQIEAGGRHPAGAAVLTGVR